MSISAEINADGELPAPEHAGQLSTNQRFAADCGADHLDGARPTRHALVAEARSPADASPAIDANIEGMSIRAPGSASAGILATSAGAIFH